MVTVLLEQSDGPLPESTREFGTFRADRLALAEWLNSLNVERVVMGSTGIYWRSIFSTLEAAGLKAHSVNARHVKQVPGRKTDVKDSQWLASLARCGLLRPRFIPPQDVRELRRVTRYRLKRMHTLAREKNRLHKVLDEAGIRLGGIVMRLRLHRAVQRVNVPSDPEPFDDQVPPPASRPRSADFVRSPLRSLLKPVTSASADGVCHHVEGIVIRLGLQLGFNVVIPVGAGHSVNKAGYSAQPR